MHERALLGRHLHHLAARLRAQLDLPVGHGLSAQHDLDDARLGRLLAYAHAGERRCGRRASSSEVAPAGVTDSSLVSWPESSQAVTASAMPQAMK